MARVEQYYKQLPQFQVVGLTIKLGAWTFSCGAIDPASPEYIFRDLPTGDIVFTADPTFDKFATLYVVPVKTVSTEFAAGSNYHLTEWLSNPALSHVSNPPTEKWTADISVVPCLNIIVKAGATALEVTANEFDPGPPPDLRRDIVNGNWRVKAWPIGGQPNGWAVLDATVHATAFPISLGRLETGKQWYAIGV